MALNTLRYIAICSKKSSPGVYKKILGFAKGADKNGYISKIDIIVPSGIRGYYSYLNAILFSKESYIVIRYLPKLGIAIFLAGLVLMIRNQKLIIDVPTPMCNHIREIMHNNQGKVAKTMAVVAILLQGSVPFLSSYRIIQYAEESSLFSLFVNRKIVLTGNGIDVDSIQLRSKTPNWPSNELHLIAVGTTAMWHGWDKIIDLINEMKNESLCKFEIILTIVGDGPELTNLKQLTEKYNLRKSVRFTGLLHGKDLYDEYCKAHIGLGSFGWERIGITTASPLKSREYLASGIPILYATDDIDFPGTSEVANQVNDSFELKQFFKNLHRIELPSSLACRDFAKRNLDFENKVRRILK